MSNFSFMDLNDTSDSDDEQNEVDKAPVSTEHCAVASKRSTRIRWKADISKVDYVFTEYGLSVDASEREKRAFLAGKKRRDLRRSCKKENVRGRGVLCSAARAEESAQELQKWLCEHA